jgi:hypothetical protein
MKQIIFIAILIFAFCFTASSQANENLCPNLNITTANEMARKNELVFL